VNDIKFPKVLVFISPPAPNGILKFQALTSSNGSEYIGQPPVLDQYVVILEDSFQSMREIGLIKKMSPCSNCGAKFVY
jgi:hypothetical protein